MKNTLESINFDLLMHDTYNNMLLEILFNDTWHRR